ncbi:hypothetical protein BDW71DRAFT_22893 [Aspergillus fruticulosus]
MDLSYEVHLCVLLSVLFFVLVLILILILFSTSHSPHQFQHPFIHQPKSTLSYPVRCRRHSAAQRIRLGRHSPNANRGGPQRSL